MTINNSLYNKYRPQAYDAVIGQDNTKQTLKAIVKNKSYQFNRNFLFYSTLGGVGKTTIAQIFAKAINCLKPSEDGDPCNQCPNCQSADSRTYPDIIYVDGPEFNTVDKVKPIIDIAKQHPIRPDKMKVIIIDEFQRMSSAAMSEFLPLFEFSYNKTIFILTTTDFHKVLQPIQTRCFKFELLPTTINQMVKNLQTICEKENIKYHIEDLEKIAESSNGSMRDAIQTMAQFHDAYGDLVDLPLNFQYQVFSNLIELSKSGDIETLQNKLIQIPMTSIYDQFSKFLFQRYLKTGCHLPVDSFLKYKPTEYNSMLLYFVQLHEELNKPIQREGTPLKIQEAPKVYTPEKIQIKEDNQAFMTSIGFKKDQ